jgi:hypothetical protein
MSESEHNQLFNRMYEITKEELQQMLYNTGERVQRVREKLDAIERGDLHVTEAEARQLYEEFDKVEKEHVALIKHIYTTQPHKVYQELKNNALHRIHKGVKCSCRCVNIYTFKKL